MMKWCTMINYLLSKLNSDQYYLLCMDYNGILTYLDAVEIEPLIKSNEGDLIIDQLLVAGNSKNRFITCKFSHGKVKLETATSVSGTEEYRRVSSKLLRKHLDLLKHSILTDSQLELIRQGQVIWYPRNLPETEWITQKAVLFDYRNFQEKRWPLGLLYLRGKIVLSGWECNWDLGE